MNKNPIGLFDSGIGGLTVLRALKEILPHENYIYLGDTARLPYGTKSQETIIKYALQCTEKLMENNLKLLVMACNTVSSVALPSLKEKYPEVMIIGVVKPGANAACKASKNNSIAIIGTESTINGKAYEREILAINPMAKIVAKPCPLFVPMAEEGLVEGRLAEEIAHHYLAEIFAKKQNCPDTLVLGCTHFPLLRNAIKNTIGENINLVDSAQTTAEKVHDFLKSKNMLNSATPAENTNQFKFMTTDDVIKFKNIGEMFLGLKLNEKNIELVDL